MRGTGFAVFQRLLGAVLTFVFQWMLARRLGADGAGLFFIAFQCAWIVAIFSRGGLDLALVRFVAARLAVADPTAVHDVYGYILKRGLIAATVGSFLLALAAQPLATRLFEREAAAAPIWIMALCVLPIVLYRIHGEALRGLGYVQLSQFVINLAVPLGGIASLPWLASAFGLRGALASHIFGHLIAAAIAVSAWLHALSRVDDRAPSRFDFGELGRALPPLYQLAVLSLLQNSVPTIVLGATREHAEVGVFNVAQSCAQFLLLILLGHNAYLGPEFSAKHMRGEKEQIRVLACRATRRMTLEALPLWIAFTFFPAFVLRQFGNEFLTGQFCLAILAAGQLVNVATGSIGLLLVMSGHEKAFRTAVAFALFTGVTLNILLAPRFGLIGAASATAAGIVVQNIVAAVQVRRRLGFWIHPF